MKLDFLELSPNEQRLYIEQAAIHRNGPCSVSQHYLSDNQEGDEKQMISQHPNIQDVTRLTLQGYRNVSPVKISI